MTFSASFIVPTPTDVPQLMMSPGSNLISFEIFATNAAAEKTISEIG